MKKLFIVLAIILLSVTETFAYAIKAYDDSGKLIGTYKKEAGGYQFYDNFGNKLNAPQAVPPLPRPNNNFMNNRYYVRRSVNPVSYEYADYKNTVNYVDTRYPKFHKFNYQY